MIRVIVVDDHDLVREGLRAVFNRTEDIRMVADYTDGDELLRISPTRRNADVIILDISMSRTSGMEVLEALGPVADAPPVLLLTLHPEDTYVVAAMKAGAKGYLMKDALNETVCEAIRVVARGGLYLSPAGAGMVLGNRRTPTRSGPEEIGSILSTLSDRERLVFRMLVDGSTQKEIAWELGVSDRTVSTYKQRCMQKLGVTSMVELVKIGLGTKDR